MRRMSKPYGLGILVGRFQMIHAGHVSMIGKAMELCERVGILVGSAQESGTAKNPFPYELRREMLKTLFPEESVSVYPLPDIGIGNNSGWGEYVLRNVAERFGTAPELLVSGKETRRVDWFDGVNGASVAELYVPKSIDISATRMRESLLVGDRAAWEKYTDERLWKRYEELRALVTASAANTKTMSI